MKSFSPRNLKYICKFAQEYPDVEFVQEVLAQLTCYHQIALLDKVSNHQERLFYVKQAIEDGWSRNAMVSQIEKALHQRQGKVITNLKEKLPSLQSDLAHDALKDPYLFDFLSIGDEAHEREVEKALIQHMEKFLLELGAGFGFVGRQYHLELAIIELQDNDFKPEYAGRMNFYLSAVDDLVKHANDPSSIGLILCKSKNSVLAEYTLRDMTKPIGLAEYKLCEALPENLSIALPSIEELEEEFNKGV